MLCKLNTPEQVLLHPKSLQVPRNWDSAIPYQGTALRIALDVHNLLDSMLRLFESDMDDNDFHSIHSKLPNGSVIR